ncbi:MAG: PhnD/SsuA/transferrin family substrate-binding protein, partial [Alphaproteobacteria bacterium]
MTTSRRAFLGTVAGALIFAGGAARAAGGLGPLNEVRIGYQKEGILAVVKQRGAIEARLAKLGVRKVRWVLFKYGMPMMEALGAGSIDIASVGDTPPVFAQAAGMNVLYVAAAPAAQNAILVAPRSPLRSAADLRGRKVALVRGSSSHNFTIQALKAAGLQFADIVPTFLDPADAERALMRGDVDAWTVWDPYIALAELRHKVRAIATNETIYPSSSF